MRIFIKHAKLEPGQPFTTSQDFHHITRVMRSKVGATIECVTTEQDAWECKITQIHNDTITLVPTTAINSISTPLLHLAFALIKPNRISTLIEKCTEVGVTHFYPLITQHTQEKFTNIDRLRNIAESAARQSKACTIPQIYTPATIHQLPIDNEWVVCCTQSAQPISAPTKIAGVLIGPEGGWSAPELGYMQEKSVRPVSLGARILRSETAAIVASFCALNRSL
jgi:16S rRNA (uracil1498-N3)-methyltransferase